MEKRVGLLFEWPGRHHVQVLLPLGIVVAAAAHAAVFLLFSIVYPPAQANGPDAVQANFVLPGTAEAGRVRAILSIQDPTLFAPGRGLPESSLAKAEYRPGFASEAPPLESPGPRSPATPASPRTLGIVAVEAPAAASALETRRPETGLLAFGALRDRLPESFRGEFAAAAGFVPAPTRFLLGVRPDGSVAHVFLQESSGNASLDAAASRELGQSTFAAGGDRIVWDVVKVNWGGDIRAVDEP
ncbi:MAG: hypothetical protein SFU53_07660 [Terrimicrobiaceae bacterium]|nr:hypothetical protein [Terrimicrobiaceae bacterium]